MKRKKIEPKKLTECKTYEEWENSLPDGEPEPAWEADK
jgi:hypothetical protein